jgi:hypothetical protein
MKATQLFPAVEAPRTTKMHTEHITMPKGTTAAQAQSFLRASTHGLISEKINTGLYFLRTESQNNKIRAFFTNHQVFEVSLHFA